eukprot:g1893.t1
MGELSQDVDDMLYGEGNFNFIDEFNTQGSQFENLSQNTLGMPYDTTQGTQEGAGGLVIRSDYGGASVR